MFGVFMPQRQNWQKKKRQGNKANYDLTASWIANECRQKIDIMRMLVILMRERNAFIFTTLSITPILLLDILFIVIEKWT